MKKLLSLIFLAMFAQIGWAQLDVKVTENEDEMIVEFPAGQTFEYKIFMVDPIVNGNVEMQFSKVMGGKLPTNVTWHTAAGMNYQLAYRYPLASGEYSDWYKVDPQLLLQGEGK